MPGDGQGFPKSRRLLKRTDFQAAYNAGAKHAGAYILLFHRIRDDGDPGRIGLTATRKIGKANVRNRGKRLLREAVRRHWEIVPDGWDCVLHLLARIRGACYAEVEADVKRLFARAAADEARRRAKLEG